MPIFVFVLTGTGAGPRESSTLGEIPGLETCPSDQLRNSGGFPFSFCVLRFVGQPAFRNTRRAACSGPGSRFLKVFLFMGPGELEEIRDCESSNLSFVLGRGEGRPSNAETVKSGFCNSVAGGRPGRKV